jgi:hypothetical protein
MASAAAVRNLPAGVSVLPMRGEGEQKKTALLIIALTQIK